MNEPTDQTASIESLLRRLLGDIAPDADTAALDADADVRDALDLDSVDLLNFAVAVHDETGVDIPERDYAKVRTVRSCAVYVAAHAEG